MEFSRQEYWSGLPFPSPGDLPDPGIEPKSPTLQADTLPSLPVLRQQMSKSFCLDGKSQWRKRNSNVGEDNLAHS